LYKSTNTGAERYRAAHLVRRAQGKGGEEKKIKKEGKKKKKRYRAAHRCDAREFSAML
jgi:hypothetical protein